MACSVPICYLLHREILRRIGKPFNGTRSGVRARRRRVGSEVASGGSITFGRQMVLEGADLETAIAESLAA